MKKIKLFKLTNIAALLSVFAMSVFTVTDAAAQEIGYEMTPVELNLFNLVNQELKKQGVGPMRPNEIYTKVARLHAKDMCERNFVSNMNPDGLNEIARLEKAGYNGGITEQIAAGYTDPEKIVKYWFYEKPLGTNRFEDIKDDRTSGGVGFYQCNKGQYGTYWVLDRGVIGVKIPGDDIPVNPNPNPVPPIVVDPIKPNPNPVPPIVVDPIKPNPNPVPPIVVDPIKPNPNPVPPIVVDPIKPNPNPVPPIVVDPIKPNPNPVPPVFGYENYMQSYNPSKYDSMGRLKQGSQCYKMEGSKIAIGSADSSGNCVVKSNFFDTPLSNVCTKGNLKPGCLCAKNKGDLLNGKLVVDGQKVYCQEFSRPSSTPRNCSLKEVLDNPSSVVGCRCRTEPGSGRADGIVYKEGSRYKCNKQ